MPDLRSPAASHHQQDLGVSPVVTLGSGQRGRRAGDLGRAPRAQAAPPPPRSRPPAASATYFPEPLTPITSNTSGASISQFLGPRRPLPGQGPPSPDVTGPAPADSSADRWVVQPEGSCWRFQVHVSAGSELPSIHMNFFLRTSNTVW
ncbi:uncharacterized protein LOC121829644 [Peromyscus maniculatus bairdii]|uniref:uncharacterized protein LOC121829644 n=1 Tax=Peromyscus maniculatus bairdii TaxID=230844 RepID=UPI003FD28981